LPEEVEGLLIITAYIQRFEGMALEVGKEAPEISELNR